MGHWLSEISNTDGQIRTFIWMLGRAEHHTPQSITPQILTYTSETRVAKAYDGLEGKQDITFKSTFVH